MLPNPLEFLAPSDLVVVLGQQTRGNPAPALGAEGVYQAEEGIARGLPPTDQPPHVVHDAVDVADLRTVWGDVGSDTGKRWPALRLCVATHLAPSPDVGADVVREQDVDC